MSEMNKEFTYRGYRFNINVSLNIKIEKRIDGLRWHRVVTNCMDYDNYYQADDVEDMDLQKHLISCELRAKKYIDMKDDIKDPNIKMLVRMGFK